MPPEVPLNPEMVPVKVEVVGIQSKRDSWWWITAVGSVVITALALVVAIISLIDQHAAERDDQAAAARTYASEVSFFQGSSGAFEIDNNAPAEIHSVLLQSKVHGPLSHLGTVQECTEVTIFLPAASQPTLYFQDANGLGWELPINGAAQPSGDPSAIIALLPTSAVSNLPSAQIRSTPLHGCL